ncbi:MAG: ABC transporter ATP-binding protein [bacterium]
MLAIDIKGLGKTYTGGTKALKGVDLQIKEGDFFALLGANGAGKTTIIGILTGLVNKTGGSGKVFDYDLDSQMNQVKQQIGVVPQEFNFGIFEKVIDIVVNQAGYYGIAPEKALPRAKELLTALGLSEKMDQPARNLSGGMKRRLMIARGLIHEPRLLILDEPTAGVDVELRHGMWEYLVKLNKQGTTILLTTHYLEEVEQLCHNAAIIKEGKIIKNDSVKNLLRSMERETYVVETENLNSQKLKIKKYDFTVVDDKTLEVVVQRDQSLNLLITELTEQGINVHAIRPKGNRLEELFLNILKK